MYSITAVAQRLGLNVVRGRFRCIFSERHAHGDRTPSVSINEEKGFFKCFVCDEVKGKAVTLVQLVMGISKDDAVKWLKDDSPSIIRDSQKFFLKKRTKIEEKPNFFKEKMIFEFLSILQPIQPYSTIGWWLANRGIYKPTWDKVLLRCIDDYTFISNKLLGKYSLEDLQIGGLFNSYGQLRYGKRPLIIPYIDEKNRPFFFQARAIDKNVSPKELNFQGAIPFPYNKTALDGKPGTVYLCEGPIDTLTLLQRGFCAVGIPGANTFKPEWVSLFCNKKVVLCLDNDKAGRAGEERIAGLMKAAGLEAKSFGLLPEGEDINSWFIPRS